MQLTTYTSSQPSTVFICEKYTSKYISHAISFLLYVGSNIMNKIHIKTTLC